ncbi:MAG: hypothetical protein P8Y53_08400 [Pseudolabrys sp.]
MNALLLAGGAMAQPNPGLTNGHGRWCTVDTGTAEVNCAYNSLTRCERNEAPANGWCTLNQSAMRERPGAYGARS